MLLMYIHVIMLESFIVVRNYINIYDNAQDNGHMDVNEKTTLA